MTLAAGLAALWLATRPYTGIWHDGVLYAAQALRALSPESYAQDLFFLYGSQDDYTGFSPLYARVVAWLGLEPAAQLLTLVGQFLWVLGALSLARHFLGSPAGFIGLAAVIALAPHYSSHHIFRAGEPFLTARLYAEGLSMFGVAAVYRGRKGLGLASLLAALTLHPLNALPAMLLALLGPAMRYPRRSLVAASVGLSLITALAVWGTSPWSALRLTIDDAWLAICQGRSPQLFLENWSGSDWGRFVCTVLVLLGASRYGDARVSPLCRSALVLSVVGVLLTGLGADILKNALIVQLQPWRVLWLTQILALLAACQVSSQAYRERKDWIPAAGYVSAWLLMASSGAIVAALTTGYLFVRPSRAIEFRRVIAGLALLVLAIGIVSQAGDLILGWQMSRTLQGEHVQLAGRWAVMAIAWVLLLATTLFRPSGWPRWGMLALGIATAFSAASLWDARDTPSGRQASIDPAAIARLQARIDPSGVVYWKGSMGAVWFLLQRSSYISAGQLAGVVFDRRTAVEGHRRSLAVRGMGGEDGWWTVTRGERMKALSQDREPDAADLMRLCSDPVLDWIIVATKLPGAVMSFEMAGRHWHLYGCAEGMRRGA